MTVVGIGIDAVELDRMRAALDRTPTFAARVFTDAERAYCDDRRDPTERYAARFAAKEAVLKALDRGILGVSLRDIEVVRTATGKPTVRLHGAVAEQAAERGITAWQLTMTHTGAIAQAAAVAVAGPVATLDDAAAAALAEQLVAPVEGGRRVDDAAFYATLDRKRNAAGALLWDATGRLLIVKPTYRDGWTLPGGAVDAGESPRVACEREVAEELGLVRSVGALRVVDWDAADPLRGDAVVWIFEGGVLTDGEVATIRLPADELSDHAFVDPAEAVRLLGPELSARRLAAVLAADPATTLYLEGGRPVT